MLLKGYTFLYNALLSGAWGYVLFLVVNKLHASNGNTDGIYAACEMPLKYAQTAALMEILHAILGIVRSPVGTTTMQVASRILLVWGVCHSVPSIQNEFAFTMMVLAWSITEVIRYAFYALNLFNAAPYILLWCRYTFFYILYPIGVTGELWMIYHALPVVRETDLFGISMPNKYNFAFNYFYFLIGAVLAYAPGFPPLYMYMIKQRKLKLASPPKQQTE